MKPVTLNQRANHVVRFVLVQFIALLGWILVQVFFSLSPLGRTLPFTFLICSEAIWWMALLLIMLLLFLLEYQRFVQAARDLEEANTRLRRATNSMLEQIRIDHSQAGTPAPEDNSEQR